MSSLEKDRTDLDETGLSIALMSVFLSGAVLIGIDREVEKASTLCMARTVRTYGYGMNQWAKSEGLPVIGP